MDNDTLTLEQAKKRIAELEEILYLKEVPNA